MPNIHEYTPQVRAPGPVDIRQPQAQDFDVGGGLQAAGAGLRDAADKVQRYNEQNEVSDLGAKMAQAQADWTIKWQDRIKKADPADGTVADKFMEEFDQGVQPLGEDISTPAGRRFFNDTVAKMREHFAETAVQGQSELAGIKAKSDYTTMVGGLSSGLVNDPTSYRLAKDLHDSTVKELVSTGRLPSEMAEKLKVEGQKDLAKAMVRGWINANPELAKQGLQAGKWDMDIADGDIKNQLLGEADQEIRARMVEAERLKKQQKEQLEAQQRDTQNQFIAKLAGGNLTKDEVIKSNLEPFGSGSKEQMLQLMRTAAVEDKIKDSPATVIELYRRIHLPDGDPNKLVDENDLNQYFGHGITLDTLNNLRGELQGRRTTAGQIESDMKKQLLEVAKGQLIHGNPLTGLRDPQGEEQYLKYFTFFSHEYDDQRKKGKSPRELLDPSSPDYLGKYIRSYTKSQQQIITDLVGSMNQGNGGVAGGLADPALVGAPTNGQPPPGPGQVPTTPAAPGAGGAPAPAAPAPSGDKARRPGETAKQYLERMGK